MTIREITGIQHLNAGLVIAVKRGGRVWTTSVARLGRIREPDSQMINLYGASGWIAGRIVEKYRRCRSNAGRLDESFFVEDAGEVSDTSAVRVGDDVPLVPRQAKWTFRNLTQFRGNSQFSTWLIRITVNESLMKLRKRRSIREVSMDEDFQNEEQISPFEFADWAPNPEELYGRTELRDILRSVLQELQPSLRVVFVLRDIQGLSTEQTAEVLELSHDAVKARLWRVRLKLRRRLSKYFGVAVAHS